ncbi:MAG: glycosyltransferase [Spirochaetaceae bacterium]|jgi:1,2-diacylglycerol 3-alpha-glucosyltransferase|nr:glycosyltransferase [Spirochaetaceae bacterium]
MNIALFTDSYTPQVNGVVTVVRALKTELEKRGHNAYVFTVWHPNATEEDGVFRVKSFRFPYEPQHRVGFFFEPQLVRQAKELKLDIIHTHTEFSLMLAARSIRHKLKIPSIHTLHTHYPDYLYYSPWLLRLYFRNNMDKYFNFILRSQRCVIAPSQKNKIFLGQIKFKKPVKVIPNGIDLSYFYQTNAELAKAAHEFRAKFNLTPENKVIVFVGRLGTEKNLNVLLDNFKMIHQNMNEARLLLVGDGPDHRELVLYAQQLGIFNTVVFTGFLRWPDEIKTAYKASDLFMSASHSEVHPVTFIEAMAAGLPIVAPDDVSITDMVLPGENGWTVQDDRELWVRALEILNDKALRSAMGKKSEVISKKYSVEKFIDSMLDVYKEYAKHPL